MARVRNRKSDTKLCPSPSRVQFNLPVVPQDQPPHDIQAKSRAFSDGFCGEKWIEDAVSNLGRNSGPIVNYLNHYRVSLSIGDQLHVSTLTDGIQGIVDQVGPHLVEFPTESIHAWKILL